MGRESCGRMSVVIFKSVVKKNLIENMPLSEARQEVSEQAIWRSEEACKGPEGGVCVVCIKYCKEAPQE